MVRLDKEEQSDKVHVHLCVFTPRTEEARPSVSTFLPDKICLCV